MMSNSVLFGSPTRPRLHVLAADGPVAFWDGEKWTGLDQRPLIPKFGPPDDKHPG